MLVLAELIFRCKQIVQVLASANTNCQISFAEQRHRDRYLFQRLDNDDAARTQITDLHHDK